ncbi:two-component system activity regulator YycH, partial [Pseudomonas sp. 2822-17]|uniref:two-component system activity regulator YycH n=1 Tax=Pseudomonas sp. 2822-17 TaxID=1712678 RepID=UPI0034D28851
MLRYNHPTSNGALLATEGHVVVDSVDFINNHAGWTGKYRLDNWNHSYVNDNALFRLNVQGIPVLGSNYNREEYYTISLTRSGNQIT